jgi:D-3-phosphoglycerate dehydrogenase
MKPRILLTTTSFQDTPGEHHKMLAATGWEVVTARGPLSEADTLALIGDFDGYICGDDMITKAVIEKALLASRSSASTVSASTRLTSKLSPKKTSHFYFTPGVNHTTVAEHTFLLLLALEKNFYFHTDSTRSGGWKRKTGHELLDINYRYHRDGTNRQRSRNPCPCLWHESSRIRFILG